MTGIGRFCGLTKEDRSFVYLNEKESWYSTRQQEVVVIKRDGHLTASGKVTQTEVPGDFPGPEKTSKHQNAAIAH